MKRTVMEMIRAIVVGLVMPISMVALVLALTPTRAEGQQNLPTQVETILPTHGEEILIEPTETVTDPIMIDVIVDGQSREMKLEDYVLAVVLGEMPADFAYEALKAQAVVARTYTLKTVSEGKRHAAGAVCDVSSCCQAYCDPADFLQQGGSTEQLEKVRSAVEDTAGSVLFYDGKLITATYFSCSGGTTEDALEVWGYDVPYLQSVSSPGEEDSAAYARKITLSAAEFQSRMAIRLQGNPAGWFGKVTYTRGGGVATIEIGGVTYRGTTIRKLLNLRSTLFTIAVDGDSIIITTKGYGHRVGMSQYGADAMAASGSSFEEILAYYYVGTQLESWSESE